MKIFVHYDWESVDAMTANFARVDWKKSVLVLSMKFLVNRVVYDISNKPPSTIECE